MGVKRNENRGKICKYFYTLSKKKGAGLKRNFQETQILWKDLNPLIIENNTIEIVYQTFNLGQLKSLEYNTKKEI